MRRKAREWRGEAVSSAQRPAPGLGGAGAGAAWRYMLRFELRGFDFRLRPKPPST
jgi:hypothetical protein